MRLNPSATPGPAVSPPLDGPAQAREVQQGTAGKARARGAARPGFGARASRLIDRVLNAVTPRGVRVDSKVRAARAETDLQVGKMLKGVSLRAVGAVAVKAQTESSRVEFEASVRRNLMTMSADDLTALQKGVADIANFAPEGTPLRDQAQVIRDAVTQECNRRLNDCVEKNLAYNMRQNASLAHLPAANGIEVSNALWLEINRADFVVNGRPLIDKSQPAGDLDTLRLLALGQLRQQTRSSPAQLMTLSRIAHQGAMGFIAEPGFVANSPLRLPDGTPCLPVARGNKLSFDIRKVGADNNLMVRCQSEVPLTHLLTPQGKQVTLEQGAKATFTYWVSIGADGRASVAQPLHTDFGARPDEWSADHPDKA